MSIKSKNLIMLLGIALLVLAGVFGWLKFRDVFYSEESSNNSSTTKAEQKIDTENQEFPVALFNKGMHPLDLPGSIWWIVNKTRPLPDGYKPDDLIVPNVRLRLASSQEQMKYRKVAAADLKALFDAAEGGGIKLVFGSGFRSEALQRQFYNSYVAKDGQAAADRYSARPGTSEHQTGLSFDATSISQTCHLEICFADQPEGQWLASNSYKYGFIIRYPDGKESITGYQYEPWHMRYVGVELATEMHDTGIQTLEEFFGLPAAPDYL